MSQLAAAIYERCARTCATTEGAIIPARGGVTGGSARAARATGCTSSRHRIDEPWRDEERGYKPGEMTTREHVEFVLDSIIEAGGVMSQAEIADRMKRETDKSKSLCLMRVSASLYWLRVVGGVASHGRRKVGGSRRPIVFWRVIE